MDKNNKQELYTVLFMNLVLTFQTAAMQQLGLVKNPLTDKIEKNLDQARMSIDMLDMVEKKTSGNLTEEEARFLTAVLDELKLKYVSEVNKSK